jgi:RimJ/RimL family protein N-acetyltransferase
MKQSLTAFLVQTDGRPRQQKMSITLRDVRPEDEAFLLEVYASTRAEEMALVPWPEVQREAFVRMQFTAQDSHYHSKFPDADYKVILSADEPVGRIYLFRDEKEIRIIDVTVLPQRRNSGIGTGLIKTVMDEGSESARAVRIYVETVNPSQRLFARLGFVKIAEEGFNLLLEWQPDKNRADHAGENRQ